MSLLLLLTIACFPRLDYDVPKGSFEVETGADDTAGGLDTSDSGTDDTGTPVGDLVVDAVVPADGPITGGLDVHLAGGGWGDSARVWFGEAEGTVTRITTGELTVTLPAGEAAGVVDVRVESGDESGALRSGFRYWVDSTGDAVMLASSIWLEPGNPDLWTTPAPTLSVVAHIIEPVDVSYFDLLGAGWDSCSRSVIGVDRIDGPDHIEATWTAGSYEVSEGSEAGYYYLNEDMTSSYVAHASMDLVVPDGGTYPAFEVPGAWQFPATVDVTWPDLSAASAQVVDGDPLTVVWSSGHAAFARVYAYDLYNGAVVDCVVKDDGSFVVPTGSFAGFAWYYDVWQFGYIADVVLMVITYEENAEGLGFSNGEIRTVAGYGQYGLARLWDWDL